jgi:multidrug efflux pump subunit AcrA (membrane-fusion protein)
MTSPDQHDHDAEQEEPRRGGGLVRRVLNQGPSPEQRLEELLARRREELDEHAGRLRESIAELERREELLRDSRASVERMLRLGTSDLEAREAELTDFLGSLTEREAAVSDAEAELARRRQELGAVELKRAAVERRERALAEREEELQALRQQLDERETQLAERDVTTEPVELVFLPGERYRIVEIEPVVLTAGYAFDVDDVEYIVARVGRSPLPDDGRRCAYLVRGRGGLPASGGSS